LYIVIFLVVKGDMGIEKQMAFNSFLCPTEKYFVIPVTNEKHFLARSCQSQARTRVL
jgi:hypothetical protein